MKNERFEYLLASLLECALSADEQDELVKAMESDPSRAARVKELLAFEPALVDLAAGGNREDAFVRRIQSTLEKTKGSEKFIQAVVARATEDQARSGVHAEIEFGTGVTRFAEANKRRKSSRRARRTSAKLAAIRARRRQGQFLWPTLLAACLLVGVTVYYAIFANGGMTEKPVAIGKVIYVTELTKEAQPALTLVRADGSEVLAKEGDELFNGDQLKTGSAISNGDETGDQSATKPVLAGVKYAGADIDLANATSLTFLEAKRLKLDGGLLRLNSKGSDNDLANARIETKFGSVELGSVTDVAFDLLSGADSTRLRMERGEANFKGRTGIEKKVSAFQEILALKDGKLVDRPVTLAEIWKGRMKTESNVVAEIEEKPIAPPLDGQALVIVVLEDFGTALGTNSAQGMTQEPFLEELPGAIGGKCIAVPGIGKEVAGEIALAEGEWHLWVRFRDDESGKPSFEVLVNGNLVGSGTCAGADQSWHWQKFKFRSSGKNRIILRSSFRGVPDPNPGPHSTHPYNVVNRWDEIHLTQDADYLPKP